MSPSSFYPFACVCSRVNFIAMVPLASMLGVFIEELAAHTNDVMGDLINATFGNAVELAVSTQALLANDFGSYRRA